MADLERTARRYQRAAKALELTAVALIGAMAMVLLLGHGPWVSTAACCLLGAAVVVYLAAWPLQRRAADARWQALEARWKAARAEREGDRG